MEHLKSSTLLRMWRSMTSFWLLPGRLSQKQHMISFSQLMESELRVCKRYDRKSLLLELTDTVQICCFFTHTHTHTQKCCGAQIQYLVALTIYIWSVMPCSPRPAYQFPGLPCRASRTRPIHYIFHYAINNLVSTTQVV